MSKINEILVGWANTVKDRFNALQPEIKEISEKRLNVCNECQMRNGSICDPRRHSTNIKTGKLTRGCGCNLLAKTMSPSSNCPLSKWQDI